MAKKITNTDEFRDTEVINPQPESDIRQQMQETVPDATDMEEAKPAPARQKVKPAEEKNEERSEPDEYALSILRSHTSYESLYIDKSGGAFTPCTPAAMRKGAALYKNPFYKPQ